MLLGRLVVLLNFKDVCSAAGFDCQVPNAVYWLQSKILGAFLNVECKLKMGCVLWGKDLTTYVSLSPQDVPNIPDF